MTKSLSITLLNPHADDFTRTPLSFWLVRRRGLGKYAYLIDEPIRQGEQVHVLVDGTLSSVLGQTLFNRLPRWLRAVILRIELPAWILINGLRNKVIVHWSPDTIADRKVLYVFSYKNCVGAFPGRKNLIDQFDRKIINLSHYFIRTSEKAKNIVKLDNVILTAESDLRHNAYFKNFFTTDQRLLVLPFAVGARFKAEKPFSKRAQICAATGTFHNLYDEKPPEFYRDFIGFYRLDTYHPVRRLLYRQRDGIKDWLDNRISLYREKSGRGDLVSRLMTALRLDVSQSEYFAFDIVDFYNDHKFAIVGEEVTGSPTIGFFEAMACGCAVLGQEGTFYDGLGLKPGIHYLAHDGTLEGIKGTIDAVLAEPGRAEKISATGQAYIAQNATPAAVWAMLRRQLEDLAAAS